MSLPRNTGFPIADAENDFLRARRHQVLSRLAWRLRGKPDDVNVILPFHEVIAAVGQLGERYVGLRVIPLDAIVGSVDRTRDFDRQFRPTSVRVRERWQRLAVAQRRGESMPPIEAYKVGEMYFVRDGHHRVSVAHALGLRTIEAYVTEITTRIQADGINRRGDIVMKDHRREFVDRVPLPPACRERISFTDPKRYGDLSLYVEGWGFRPSQQERRYLSREDAARRWFDEEYAPVTRMLRQADLLYLGDTEADAYLKVACLRWDLIRSHDWPEEIFAKIRAHRG
jgi:hypothetical protein